MIDIFFPDEMAASAYRIDYMSLYGEGRRGLIFDIDNTLVPHGAPADDRACSLFRLLRGIGFNCCLLSNNRRSRVEMFNRDIRVHEVWMANKPLPWGYRKAMERMGTASAETVFIGDQVFTDVWGAGRLGIYTILVTKLNPREEIQIVLKRLLEGRIVEAYKKSSKYSRKHELREDIVPLRG